LNHLANDRKDLPERFFFAAPAAIPCFLKAVCYVILILIEKTEAHMTQDEKYMREALKQAKKAYDLGEVPIGCVIVYQGRIIGRGYNRRNTDRNTLAHAEITAINKASKALKDWRLEECSLYVTLEPCQMCAGAIVQARVTETVIGAMNPKAGCGGSILNILEMPEFNHQVIVRRGVLQEDCTSLLNSFFKELRERNKIEKQLRRNAK